MYKDIGNKIMTLAVAFCIIGMIISIILGIIVLGMDVTYGIIILVVGPVMSWLNLLLMYGFGRLIDNSEVSRESLNQIKMLLSEWSTKLNNETANDGNSDGNVKTSILEPVDVGKPTENVEQAFQNTNTAQSELGKQDPAPIETPMVICPYCGNSNIAYMFNCTKCGKKIKN